MMNIAFDIDGVMTNIAYFQLKYGQIYFKREPINRNGFTISEMFGCSETEEKNFWKKYLFKYITKEPAREGLAPAIKKLKEDGNNIYIITSRVFAGKDNALGKFMRFMVSEWLKYNHIIYDEIIFCEHDKKQAVIENYISIMIEDNVENIKQLSEIIDVICVDCNHNKHVRGSRIYHINPEYIETELEEKINIIKLQNRLDREDPIKPYSGMGSIDKPFNKYYSELQTHAYIPYMSLYEYLYKNNKNNMNAKAISYFKTTLTFKQFFDKIDESAKAFKSYGVNKGDIVSICMPNTPEGVIAFYAINKIGAIANMIHPLSSEKEIEHYLIESKSKILVMIDISYEKVNNIINRTMLEKCIVVSPKDSMPLSMQVGYSILNSKNSVTIDKNNKYVTWKKFIEDGKKYKKNVFSVYEKNAPAVLLHTGGSTGTPKAVMISNENFNANVEQLKCTIPSYKKGDSLLAITPIFHGFGLSNCVHTPLCVNMSISLLPQYDKKYFTQTLLKDKSNLILGVPTLWDAMLKNEKLQGKDLSFLKVLISGGDNLPLNLERDINKFLFEHNAPNPIFKGYGMTECLAASAFTPLNANLESSVGIPLPMNNYKIVKLNTCVEAELGEEGEICISGPTVMMGYYENEEETNKIIKKHADGKKWLHTGDMGYMSSNGIVYYTQRIKRIIISSGYNIYPNQIEEVIRKHPAVENCVTIGIPHQYKVNVPKVYIVLKKEFQNKPEDVLLEIKELCKKNLSKFSLPHEYEFTDSLPKTLMGKVDYRLLEEENIKKYYNQNNTEKIKVKK